MLASMSIVLALLVSTFAAAAPVAAPAVASINPPAPINPGGPLIPALPTSVRTPGKRCSLKGATIDFPAGQTTLAVPSATPKFVTLGVGIQNYTCNAGTWTSVGAVASLYDISCAVGTPLMNTTNTAASTLLKTLATKETPLLTHFFVNTTAGLEPHFNQEPFKQTGVSSTLSKTASLASPQGATNVAWLQLTNIVGSLASSAYRVDTIAGSPPTSCNAATDTKVLTVPYQAHYYFYA